MRDCFCQAAGKIDGDETSPLQLRVVFDLERARPVRVGDGTSPLQFRLAGAAIHYKAAQTKGPQP